ncbi:MAPEG family protein [Sphingomonas sp. MMS24-JH45]
MGQVGRHKGGGTPTARCREGAVEAHNHNHLMEQPTLFMRSAWTIAAVGAAGRIPVALAWLYVVLRIALPLVMMRIRALPLVLHLVRRAGGVDGLDPPGVAVFANSAA